MHTNDLCNVNYEKFRIIHVEVHMGSKVILSEICYVSVLGMLH